MRAKRNTSSTPGVGAGGVKESRVTKNAFLAVLATGGSVAKACKTVGVDRATAYNWRGKDEEFKEAWDAAREDGYDLLEDEARRRAVDGIDKPVYHAGARIDVVKEYSDTLLSLMLKGYRSSVFRDKVEHTGAEGGAIQHEVTVKFVRAGEKK